MFFFLETYMLPIQVGLMVDLNSWFPAANYDKWRPPRQGELTPY